MLRIGLVLSASPGYSETFFISKIKGLTEAGHEVIIFAKKNENGMSILPKNVKVIKPYKVSRYMIIQLISMLLVLIRLFALTPKNTLKYIKIEKKDGLIFRDILRLLYLNAHILPTRLNWLHFGFATMGIGRENVAKAIGAKAAVSLRGYDITRYPLLNKDCYLKLFCNVDKVHSISDYLYEKALLYGLSKNIPYSKITPAISITKFSTNNKLQRFSQEKIRILSIGRLIWVKGFDYSIHALSKANFDFEYTIVGEGEDRDRLMFEAYQLGIASKVKFPGILKQDNIVELMNNSDIYLQPSIQEGFCNAVLEAQATGLICIVSNAEGLPENVEDKFSGFIVQKRSEDAILERINYVLTMSEEERKQMSNYAVQRVSNEFDIKDQINKFLKFYE